MNKWLCTISLLLFVESMQAQFRSTMDYAVTQEQVYGTVREALERFGTSVDSLQVTLQTDVKSSVEEPGLYVLQITHVAPRPSREKRSLLAVRIGCRAVTQCLPFYVIAEIPAAQQDENTIQRKQSVQMVNVSAAKDNIPLIAKGKTITLEFCQDGMQIRVPAVALQSGAQGESIRVASLERHHSYVADVIDTNLVRGKF